MIMRPPVLARLCTASSSYDSIEKNIGVGGEHADLLRQKRKAPDSGRFGLAIPSEVCGMGYLLGKGTPTDRCLALQQI